MLFTTKTIYIMSLLSNTSCDKMHNLFNIRKAAILIRCFGNFTVYAPQNNKTLNVVEGKKSLLKLFVSIVLHSEYSL